MDSEALAAAISEWRERRATMRGEDDERLWRKLRLEWNYNSNHIEGNTLTYHETELLLVFGRTSGGHPMRHYEEMKAHDVAINHTRHLASAERVMGEGDIRDLNKILLKEPFWHVARTPDGQQTRKRIIPGEYKTQPNHVRTATGELHRFAEPEETPALMQAWIRDFRRGLRDSELSASWLPVFLAESHWRFLRIHPFDDGNGRTARLLTNYVLQRSGLPPMVIKGAERDRYIGALQNADAGRMEPLAGFMFDNMMWALEVGIRAAKGESIRESDDIDKEISLFVRRHGGGTPKASDLDVLDSVFGQWIRPTLERMEERLNSLRQLFHANNWGSLVRIDHKRADIGANAFASERQWEEAKQKHIAKPGFRISDNRRIELARHFRFLRYTGRGSQGFSVQLYLTWKLDGEQASLSVEINGKRVPSSARSVLYSELKTNVPDPVRTVDGVCQALMSEIERLSDKPN